MTPDLHPERPAAVAAEIDRVVPAPAYWSATREGGVKAADGRLLGYSRAGRESPLNVEQASSRWFAAAPAFAEAAIAAHGALADLVKLARAGSRNPDLLDALVAGIAAERLLLGALESTLDPLVRRDATINAAVSDLIARLPRINLE